MQALTNGGLQVGPLKGFPLRTDFVTAATYGERVLMVGEAAGLVNPLTGDGIDYALTSAKLAADYLQPLFEHGGFSKNNLAGYDQILRQSFQKSFIWSGRIHDWLLRPWLLDHLIKGANRYPSFKHRLMHLILG